MVRSRCHKTRAPGSKSIWSRIFLRLSTIKTPVSQGIIPQPRQILVMSSFLPFGICNATRYIRKAPAALKPTHCTRRLFAPGGLSRSWRGISSVPAGLGVLLPEPMSRTRPESKPR